MIPIKDNIQKFGTDPILEDQIMIYETKKSILEDQIMIYEANKSIWCPWRSG